MSKSRRGSRVITGVPRRINLIRRSSIATLKKALAPEVEDTGFHLVHLRILEIIIALLFYPKPSWDPVLTTGDIVSHLIWENVLPVIACQITNNDSQK